MLALAHQRKRQCTALVHQLILESAHTRLHRSHQRSQRCCALGKDHEHHLGRIKLVLHHMHVPAHGRQATLSEAQSLAVDSCGDADVHRHRLALSLKHALVLGRQIHIDSRMPVQHVAHKMVALAVEDCNA